MATSINLSKITKVDLRDCWQNEATDFTPWLATEENMSLLADALGMNELEVKAQEEHVGPFRADILCVDSGTDKLVLIENQLEKTDHNHLGQILTYAAGLDAVTIIWIAERFTDLLTRMKQKQQLAKYWTGGDWMERRHQQSICIRNVISQRSLPKQNSLNG